MADAHTLVEKRFESLERQMTHSMERSMKLELLCQTQALQISNLESQGAIMKDMLACLKQMHDSIDKKINPGKYWEGGPR